MVGEFAWLFLQRSAWLTTTLTLWWRRLDYPVAVSIQGSMPNVQGGSSYPYSLIMLLEIVDEVHLVDVGCELLPLQSDHCDTSQYDSPLHSFCASNYALRSVGESHEEIVWVCTISDLHSQLMSRMLFWFVRCLLLEAWACKCQRYIFKPRKKEWSGFSIICQCISDSMGWIWSVIITWSHSNSSRLSQQSSIKQTPKNYCAITVSHLSMRRRIGAIAIARTSCT